MNCFFTSIGLLLALPLIATAVVTSDESGSHLVTSGTAAFGVNLDGVVHLSGWASGVLAGVFEGYVGGFETDVTPEFTDASWGEVGIAVRTSMFRDFITSATNGQAVFVSEPGALVVAILAVVSMSLLFQRRNRRGSALSRRGVASDHE
jgi:hypothetical protein